MTGGHRRPNDSRRPNKGKRVNVTRYIWFSVEQVVGVASMTKQTFLPGQPIAYRAQPDGEWKLAEYVSSGESYTLVRYRVPGYPDSSHTMLLSASTHWIADPGDVQCVQPTPTLPRS